MVIDNQKTREASLNRYDAPDMAQMAEKGSIPSAAIENGVSNSSPHPIAAGAGLSEGKEVEELARAMCLYSKNTLCRECSEACFYKDYAKRAIDKGWRKQSEGEWIDHSEIGTMNCSWECSGCHWTTVSFTEMKHSKYCPNCGAKMKGGGV